jgi:hypothetical protein
MPSEDAAHDIFVDLDAKRVRNLLGNSRAPESRIAALRFKDRRDEFLRGPFGPWSLTGSGREQRSVFPLDQRPVKEQQRRRPDSNCNLRQGPVRGTHARRVRHQPGAMPRRCRRNTGLNPVRRRGMRCLAEMLAQSAARRHRTRIALRRDMTQGALDCNAFDEASCDPVCEVLSALKLSRPLVVAEQRTVRVAVRCCLRDPSTLRGWQTAFASV